MMSITKNHECRNFWDLIFIISIESVLEDFKGFFVMYLVFRVCYIMHN